MLAQQHRTVSTDHLGNVRATVSDILIPRGSGVFDADLRTLTDYYPFGMMMPERTLSSTDYRYGYNTQERVDEIAGEGNHYTAEYWEFDSRTARRWNLDPRPDVSISTYATFALSPILQSDHLGDSIKVGALTGIRERAVQHAFGDKDVRSELGKYAAKGDVVTIGSSTYVFDRDGEYSKAGVDLFIGEGELGNDGTMARLGDATGIVGMNKGIEKSGRLALQLTLEANDDALSFSSVLAGMYAHAKDGSGQSIQTYRNAWNFGVLHTFANFGHELILHARQYSTEFLKDGFLSTSPQTHHNNVWSYTPFSEQFLRGPLTRVASYYGFDLSRHSTNSHGVISRYDIGTQLIGAMISVLHNYPRFRLHDLWKQYGK